MDNKDAVRAVVGIKTRRFGDGGEDHSAWETAQAELLKLTRVMSPKDLSVATRATSMTASANYRRAAALNAG